jgi:drug/metabolite transporter (DMT)-like permease
MGAYAMAIASSVLFNTAIMLQARDAASAPADLEMRAALILFLLRRWMWLAGTSFLCLAVVLQTIALADISVDVLQSITAAGVLLLPVYGHVFLKQAMRPAELLTVVVLVAAVVAASMLVGSQEGHARLSAATLAIGCAAVALVPFAIARHLRDGSALMLVAGIGFSCFTVLQKELALVHDTTATLLIVAGFAASAFAGFISEMSALQTVSPMRVAPAVLGISTALPVLAAPLLFGEHWSHPVSTVTALVVVVVAAGFLAARAHAGVLAHEAPMPTG